MHKMKKLLVVILYAAHLLLLVAALLFAVTYFLSGQESLVEGAAAADKARMASYQWWGIVTAVVYSALMFSGIHRLATKRSLSVCLYASGSGIYLLVNAVSYSYAAFHGLPVAATLEDIMFNIIFIFLAGVVYTLARSEQRHNKAMHATSA